VRALLELRDEQVNQTAALLQTHEQQTQMVLQQLSQEQAAQLQAMQQGHEMQRHTLLTTCLSSLIDPSDAEALQQLENGLIHQLQGKLSVDATAPASNQHAHWPPHVCPPHPHPQLLQSSQLTPKASQPSQPPLRQLLPQMHPPPQPPQPSPPQQQPPLPPQQPPPPPPHPLNTPLPLAPMSGKPAFTSCDSMPAANDQPVSKKAKVVDTDNPNRTAGSPPRWAALITAANSELDGKAKQVR